MLVLCRNTQGARPGQCDEADAHALLDTFYQAGGNFIDTADVYQFGLSESIIGNWLVKHPELRSRIVLATKVTGPCSEEQFNAHPLSSFTLCVGVGSHDQG